MLQFLKSLFSSMPNAAGMTASLPQGERVYAIGDVHGRRDLLEELTKAIEEDAALSPEPKKTFILLGDLVDRGPDSAGVVAFAREWQLRANVRILAGNHEEMFLRSFTSFETLRHFLRHGGRDTLLSYGIDKSAYNLATIDEVQELMAQTVSQEEREFIASFEDQLQIGDYLFVHAGIAPDVPLDEQKTSDLRWIREPFLSHQDSHGVVVVHGHTITDEPVDAGNRIGIDTGAYASGRLTALVLEGTRRRYIAAVKGGNGEITIEHDPA